MVGVVDAVAVGREGVGHLQETVSDHDAVGFDGILLFLVIVGDVSAASCCLGA